ncbi:MAG: release factor glutamine methyltransferase [Alphaproteobacteria bacterium]|jgi:release factor glutamine methyltransferase
MEALMYLPDQWSNNTLTYQGLAHLGARSIQIQTHNAHHIARRLLCIMCDFDKVQLIVQGEKKPTETQKLNYYQAILRFNQHEPLSRIENIGYFYGFDFEISSDTLDPRPETELLIDLLRQAYPDTQQPLKMLDIGTGSGCLAVTAARFYPNSMVTALDICEKALIIAQRNAHRANVQAQINFSLTNDLLTDLEPILYDVILCNPPYIPQATREYLDRSVIDYDPEVALFYGDDGLGFYNILADMSEKSFKKKGSIFIEFGIGQAKCIKKIFAEKNLQNFNAIKDRNQIIRAAHIQF